MTDHVHSRDLEGMLGHPPGPERPVIIVHPRPPSFAEACHNVAAGLAANLVGLGLAAWVLSYAWNALIELHNLTTIDFNQAFTALVIVRLLALTVRL